eukprot:SAG25_NODE_95_length_15927_cov_8.666224_16_plen_268_part_00
MQAVVISGESGSSDLSPVDRASAVAGHADAQTSAEVLMSESKAVQLLCEPSVAMPASAASSASPEATEATEPRVSLPPPQIHDTANEDGGGHHDQIPCDKTDDMDSCKEAPEIPCDKTDDMDSCKETPASSGSSQCERAPSPHCPKQSQHSNTHVPGHVDSVPAFDISALTANMFDSSDEDAPVPAPQNQLPTMSAVAAPGTEADHQPCQTQSSPPAFDIGALTANMFDSSDDETGPPHDSELSTAPLQDDKGSFAHSTSVRGLQTT